MVHVGCLAYPKKTVHEIVKRENHYCISLKENQPTLLAKAQQCATEQNPVSEYDAVLDHSHGRVVERRVRVFQAPAVLSETWDGLAAFAQVERVGIRDGHPFHTQSWFILDQCLPAHRVAQLVQDHRGTIENRVHWVKDVVQQEDASLIQASNPAILMALLRNWTLSIFRKAGHDSITKAIRFCCHDLPKLISFL